MLKVYITSETGENAYSLSTPEHYLQAYDETKASHQKKLAQMKTATASASADTPSAPAANPDQPLSEPALNSAPSELEETKRILFKSFPLSNPPYDKEDFLESLYALKDEELLANTVLVGLNADRVALEAELKELEAGKLGLAGMLPLLSTEEAGWLMEEAEGEGVEGVRKRVGEFRRDEDLAILLSVLLQQDIRILEKRIENESEREKEAADGGEGREEWGYGEDEEDEFDMELEDEMDVDEEEKEEVTEVPTEMIPLELAPWRDDPRMLPMINRVLGLAKRRMSTRNPLSQRNCGRP